MGGLIDLSFMKKQADSQKQEPPKAQAAIAPDDEARLKLYRIIIERYREEIEGHESKSVSDLKGLVQPRSETILSIRDSILETFRPYVYAEHFLQAAKMCFSYVSSFKPVSAPVSFWLSFSEMKELMAGDEIDKSILLCSLVRSIGSESAKIFVTDSKASYVVFEDKGVHYFADHSKPGLLEAKGWQECLALMRGKPIYAFSDKEYEDFAEEPE
jgi:hypothetical protein